MSPTATTTSPTMTISERETRQIEQANASGRTPVVFIHGLWLLPSSWDKWVEFFEENGYAGLTPDYALVGEVTDGMDVVQAISELGEQGSDGPPSTPVVIESATPVEG